MKLEINQEVLLSALEKGSISALSDEAKNDTSNYSTLIKSVKITCGEKFTIESLTNLVAVKHSVDIGKENGIIIEEEGVSIVKAKELMDWVKNQGKSSVIKMSLLKLESPEVVEDKTDGDESVNIESAIKKIGDLKISSKDESKTVSNWELDAYDESQYPVVDFSKNGNLMFETYSQYFKNGLDKISFSALDRDYDHIYDSVSVQFMEDEVYFATTDTKRCALYKLPVVENLSTKETVMVPVKVFESLKKASEKEEKMKFSFEEESNKLFVSTQNTEMRLICSDKEAIKKFPPVKMLLDKKYDELVDIPKSALNKILVNAAIVNNSSALFEFDKDKGTLIVKAISDDGKYKPNKTKTKLENIKITSSSVWGVKHLIEGLKSVTSDIVNIKLPENHGILKISDGEDFSYFTMKINNPKYEAYKSKE